MKILYLDLGMGAAGDMLTAALYELLDDEDRASFIKTMNGLGLEGVEVCAKASKKCGITGTHIRVTVDGVSEEEHHHEEHHHEHDDHEHHHENAGHDHHHHEHGHSHTTLHDISHIVNNMPVSGNVKDDVIKIYDLIAEAESKAHDEPVTQVHFHEVGEKDAIADITAVSVLMEMLSPDKVIASPVCTGFGKVRCAHGILPVPAPATAYILKGIPAYSGNIEGEMCTPTGAAIIRHFAGEFGNMPVLRTDRIGYGMGSRDFEAANCVRALLGESGGNGSVTELSCNIDDMTAEAVAYATEVLLANGALDVYTLPIGMKKSRQGIMINVLCSQDDKEKFISLMFRYTSTIGIRETEHNRYVLSRRIEQADTSIGKVNIKISDGYGVRKKKIEYDDLKKIADSRGISVDEAADIIGREVYDS